MTRRRYHRTIITAAFVSLVTSVCWAQGMSPRDADWPRWQARVGLGAAIEAGPESLTPSVWAHAPATRVHSASLYGDYYFSLPSLTSPTGQGGFRATSGVLYGAAARGLGASPVPASVGERVALGRLALPSVAGSTDAVDGAVTLPYVGLGYTRLSVSGAWGFSADVGLISQNPGGAWRLGNALFAPQNLDDAVRSLRLTPLIHFDVRYAF